jgi:hypothetical protein
LKRGLQLSFSLAYQNTNRYELFVPCAGYEMILNVTMPATKTEMADRLL